MKRFILLLGLFSIAVASDVKTDEYVNVDGIKIGLPFSEIEETEGVWAYQDSYVFSNGLRWGRSLFDDVYKGNTTNGLEDGIYRRYGPVSNGTVMALDAEVVIDNGKVVTAKTFDDYATFKVVVDHFVRALGENVVQEDFRNATIFCYSDNNRSPLSEVVIYQQEPMGVFISYHLKGYEKFCPIELQDARE